MFCCHCSVLWVGRAMPVWHIAAFLWMFSQPAFKAHKTPGFSRMTAFILLSCRKKIPQLHFWMKQKQTTGVMPCGQLHQIAPHGFMAHGGCRSQRTDTLLLTQTPKPLWPLYTIMTPANLLTPLSSRTFNKQQQSHKSAFYGMAEA